ncbi:MAG: gliding motility-associated C-terminal domain-containing protein [Saprospiraceae bacterium]
MIDTLLSINACDSIVTYTLSFRPKASSTIDTVLCSGSSVSIGPKLFDINRPSGQVVLQAASSYGCDSTIQVNLSFVPCDTTECDFVLAMDSLVVQKNQTTFYNVLDNDQLPASFTWSVTQVSKEKSISYEYDDIGEITFTITGDFSEPIIVSYEVCTEDCDCKSSTFTIQNEALEDIVLTNVFIPNSSGKNSTLRFTNENKSLLDSELWVFNRNGDRIFYMKDYDNSWNADGFPGGIYYYVLKARGETIKKTLTIFK